jgi:hypothetical protein
MQAFVVCILFCGQLNAFVDLASCLPAALLRQAGHSFLRAQFYRAFF